MTTGTANRESKLYGLRYITSYAHQLHQFGETDDDLLDQILFLGLMAKAGGKKKSQLGQDMFALAMNGFMRGGYFVEVGAHHSSQLSNTWLLEKEYGWQGLLLEPNPSAHEDLRVERSARLVPKAAWNRSGDRLTFNATADSALSMLADLKQTDKHDRSNFKALDVETITLDDACAQNGAPNTIHYISIDVEGAEVEVLDGLDLRKRDVRAFTIEFNHDEARLAAYDERLVAAGYRRVLDIVSDFDAWYVKAQHYEAWRNGIVFPGI